MHSHSLFVQLFRICFPNQYFFINIVFLINIKSIFLFFGNYVNLTQEQNLDIKIVRAL